MKKAIIYISVLSTVMSSCGIYNKYPQTTCIDKDLFGKEYVSEDTTSLASLSWRELFTDEHLQTLIDSALIRNTDLRTARLRTNQAEAMLLNARLSYLPSLGLSADGTISKLGESTSAKTYSLGGSASWEVDIFGKITNAKRVAREALEASKVYGQAVQTNIVATVASGYYTLLMLDEQLRISEATLDNWERSVRTLESLKHHGGSVTDAAVLQAKANRMSLESTVLSIKKSIKETENSLCTLLAMPPAAIERGSLERQSFPMELSGGLPVQMLANRPDVRMAEHQLAQAFYATNAARSAFYPTINLSGSLGWTNNGGGIELNPAQWLLNAIGSLTQPLFSQGKNIANLKIAKAEQEAAELAFQQSLLNAGSEVNNALTALQTARKKLDIDIGQVSTLQEAVRKTELLMQHTSTNYLEVLTAQQSLLNAEQAVAQDKFDEIQSIISLYHALGGGVE